MIRLLITLLAVGMLVLTGCGGDSAETLFDTAQLEEKQNNPAHARRLYEDILRKYPDSKYADTARDRLDALQGSP